MKKLLHISANQFNNLEQEHFTKHIWKEIAQAFDEYHIIARSFDNTFREFSEGNLHMHLVPALGSKYRSFILSSFYIFKLIPKYKITHLLAQSPILGGITAALASKWYKIPFMCEIHGDVYFKYYKTKSFFDKIILKLSTSVFRSATKIRSLSSKMSQDLTVLGIKPEHIAYIPNRVNLKIFNPPKTDYALHQPLTILSVGRFVEQKGYDNAIQAIQCLDAKHVKLILIGGGPLLHKLSSLITQPEKIELIEWCNQEQLVKYYASADIYIQPSKAFFGEAMPRTILEAMAIGLPIIASNIGAVEGVIKHNSNGLLIEENNALDLKQKIETLINNDALRQKLGSAAYQTAIHEYEWNACFNMYRDELSNMQLD